ncbi:hypothetical protein ONZ45_g17389 [Pleurotus djamor]|nr:hypothetical protein ONZ45_g17389 [Pleurotus djamor]
MDGAKLISDPIAGAFLVSSSPAGTHRQDSPLPPSSQPHALEHRPQPSAATEDAEFQLQQHIAQPTPQHHFSSRANSLSPTMRTHTPKATTPRPSGGDPGSSEPNRPLNVTDALSYLDAVKVQFQEKPDVYNRFLDIMKDFKSQAIDTPGVIDRVSRLFHGNLQLIQGFNTFLPVGYRIEVSADPADPSLITVTTPSGTITQSTTSLPSLPTPSHGIGSGVHPSVPFLQSQSNSHLGGPGSRSMTPQQYFVQGQYNDATPVGSHQTTAAASFLGNLNGRNGQTERVQGAPASGEFNHAIQYLNKIKARYSSDPNTYKQFLDILQTYQKEQRQIQNSQVYVQVQMLFKDAPDLLDEFKDFLPEIGFTGPPGPPAIMLASSSGAGPSQWTPPDISMASIADKASKRAPVVTKRKRRPVDKEPTPPPVPPPKTAQGRLKKPKPNPKDADSPAFSPYAGPSSPPLGSAIPQLGMMSSQSLNSQHIHPHHAHAPAHGMTHGAAGAPDKLLFFDRAKKALESRDVYEEFLKLLSLFSKDIIDVKTLIKSSQGFLGEDLMVEFRDLLGWDERRDGVTGGPPGSIRTGPPEALSALPADDGEGPSYRRLPDSEVRLACSGRDELCRSVLNDEWVSHPTWASEDAGFVTHKKNAFEEALHKSEEERHEYHVHLEALSRTIALLEPLSARIDTMTNEDRSSFKLGPNFGGPSKCLYHRVIRKIYGREAGLEVIQALQECPSVSVPVVVRRLKQKDEEWRRAQREWGRTWREVDAKNFYKSLDHQGISFKQNDKKAITAKHFVADIEAVKAQQVESQAEDRRPAFARGSVGYQLEYDFKDTSVLHDSLKMVYSFLDHSQGAYSPQERRGVEKFLRSFVPLLCMYPANEFNAACGPLDGADDDASTHDASGHGEGQRSKKPTAGNPSVAVAAGDLRKKLLKTAQEKLTGSSIPSRAEEESKTASHGRAEDIWIRESTSSPQGFEVAQMADPLLYSRLLTCKQIGLQLAAEKHRSLLANPVAAELGLDDPNGPPAILAQAMESMGDHGIAEGANVVYMYLLDAWEKVFDGELDQAIFEEHMRWFFGNKGYHVFTLDKLITALVKQVQTILLDNKCQELWTLFQSTQSAEALTNQDIIRYRREAEHHVGQDDPLYRIQWERAARQLRMQLIGTDDPSVDGDASMAHRWREYVDTYVMHYPTEWVPESKDQEKKCPVFLRRNLRASDEAPARPSGSGMVIRIGFPSYKLVYEFGSEDCLTYRWSEEECVTLRAFQVLASLSLPPHRDPAFVLVVPAVPQPLSSSSVAASSHPSALR